MAKFNSTGVHLDNFLSAIRDRKPLNSSILEGHKSNLLCHLRNMALRAGHVLNCIPETGRLIDDKKASRLWGREYEEDWKPSS